MRNLPNFSRPLINEEHLLLITVPHTGTSALSVALKPYFEDVQAFPNKVIYPELVYKPLKQFAHAHFRKKTKPLVMDDKWKKITLLRDPMLTVISQLARKVEWGKTRPELITKSWEMWAKYFHRFELIDLKDEKRIGCQLRFVSSTKNYDLHNAYKQGDYLYVKKQLGSTWNKIVSLEPVLTPIFDELGVHYPWQS